MKLPSKKWLLTIGILLLFIITNPSVSAFKTYLGEESYQGLNRPVNLFIFSVYKDYNAPYIGLLGNFIDVGHHPISVNQYVTDSINRVAHEAKMNDSVNSLIGLYTNLLKEGYTKQNLGSLDDFGHALSNPDTATKIYMNLTKDGYTVKNLGTLTEFKKTFCRM